MYNETTEHTFHMYMYMYMYLQKCTSTCSQYISQHPLQGTKWLDPKCPLLGGSIVLLMGLIHYSKYM